MTITTRAAGEADLPALPALYAELHPAAHRRSGVGTALLEAAHSLARQEHCYKIQLLSRSSRVAAHAFYESWGFRTTAQGYRRYLD